MAAAPSTPPTNLQRLEALEARERQQDERIAKLEAVIAGMAALFGGGVTAADDRDLDGPKGDEKVRFDPRDWKGPSQKGLSMSRCLPEFLDLYAETMTYFANNQTDPKKAGFDKKTAARALGWARRIRGGWTPPPAPPAPTFGASGGGSGFGTASRFGATGGGFGQSNGQRGFLGGAPPAAPAAPAPSDEEPIADDEFPFGANAPASAQATTATEDDDDPPL